MEFNSDIKMTGSLSIKQYDVDGQLIGDLFVPNLVVTAGKEYIANRMTSNNMSPMSYMAIGQSTTASAATQTTLLTEAQRAVISATTINGTAITYSSTFTTFASTIAMTEAGIFNQSASKAVTFDGNLGISGGIITTMSPSLHTFATTNEVRYSNGGGSSVGGLVDGNIYYIIAASTTSVKLATSAANATAGTFITLTAGSGTAHKLTFGTMLCRTTFPVVSKSTTDTIVISWTVTVG